MTQDSSALARSDPALLPESEYNSIHQALMASARGQWFLEEYARRNRNSDTIAVLAAVDRVEATLRGEAPRPAPPPEALRAGLAALSEMIAGIDADVTKLAALELEAGAPLPLRRVIGTLRDLRDCIATMLGECTPAPAQPRRNVTPPEPVNLRVIENTPQPAESEANTGPLAALMAMTDAERIALFS